MRPGTLPRTGRLDQIDGLRAMAALSVMLFHYTTRFDEVFAHASPIGFGLSQGFLGVNLFFVISGFVILMTIESAKSPADFVFSRFTRLFPTYWVAVLLTWLLTMVLFIPGNVRSVPEVLANLTMLHGGFGVPSVDGAYWSLEVELIYYLWMVVLSTTGCLRHPHRVILVWLTLAAVGAGMSTFLDTRTPYVFAHYALLRWIPWFSLGMLAYLRWTGRSDMRTHTVYVAFAFLTISLGGDWNQLAAAVLAFTAVSLAAEKRFAIMGWRPLVIIGAFSYPLYLIHEQLGWLVMLKAQASGVLPSISVAIAVALSCSVAWGLHHAVELPCTRLLRARWAERQQAKRTAAGSRVFAISALFALLVLALGSKAVASMRPGTARTLEKVNGLSPVDVQRDCAIRSERPRTVVLLVLGQSNAASHGERVDPASTVTAFSAGHCVQATDPLPGTSGAGSSLWTAVVPLLETARPDWQIVVAPLAIGGTSVNEWTGVGPLRELLDEHLSTMKRAGITPQAILWQQGETDMGLGTEAQDYLQGLRELRRRLDHAGFTAPLFVARSTYCRGLGAGTIRRVIERHVDSGLEDRILPGPDTDSIGMSGRSDDCHFSAEGRKRAAQLWVSALLPELTHAVAGP